MDVELAGRLHRLVARLIDLFILIVLVYSAGGAWDRMILQIFGSLGLVVLPVFQIALLTTAGQTIGKKLMKIRIIKVETGDNGGFITNVLIREVLNLLFKIIPFYEFVDALAIFREDRRCVHDFIAGTVVIQA